MIIQHAPPFTITISRDGVPLGTVELSTRASWRLTQYAVEGQFSLADMLAECVRFTTEEGIEAPSLPLPEIVEAADAEERELFWELRKSRN